MFGEHGNDPRLKGSLRDYDENLAQYMFLAQVAFRSYLGCHLLFEIVPNQPFLSSLSTATVVSRPWHVSNCYVPPLEYMTQKVLSGKKSAK